MVNVIFRKFHIHLRIYNWQNQEVHMSNLQRGLKKHKPVPHTYARTNTITHAPTELPTRTHFKKVCKHHVDIIWDMIILTLNHITFLILDKHSI